MACKRCRKLRKHYKQVTKELMFSNQFKQILLVISIAFVFTMATIGIGRLSQQLWDLKKQENAQEKQMSYLSNQLHAVLGAHIALTMTPSPTPLPRGYYPQKSASGSAK